MKTSKAVSILVLCFMVLFSATSCVVLLKKDNGNHKGWFKNPKNPHNPNYMDMNKHTGSKK